MKADQIISKFRPDMRIVARDGEFIVSFDSMFEADVDRTSKMIRVPDARGVANFRVAVTGFTSDDCQQVGDFYEYHGDITLYQTLGETNQQPERRFVLASPRIRLPQLKKGVPLPAEEVHQKIRNAVADVFSSAIKTLYGIAPAGERSAVASSSDQRHGLFGRLLAKKWLMALVAAPAVILVLLVLATHLVKGAQLPGYDAAAINHAMAQQPDITAQVEQTRQILKEMNLDPGSPGDMGCLAR